ncbi:MAG: hypothetical protein K2X29_05550 [Candidatus Obscuribacterales bacterium]|nr:hypothetical protein [Candidatus Obscuribacterales bacterium]
MAGMPSETAEERKEILKAVEASKRGKPSTDKGILHIQKWLKGIYEETGREGLQASNCTLKACVEDLPRGSKVIDVDDPKYKYGFPKQVESLLTNVIIKETGVRPEKKKRDKEEEDEEVENVPLENELFETAIHLLGIMSADEIEDLIDTIEKVGPLNLKKKVFEIWEIANKVKAGTLKVG